MVGIRGVDDASLISESLHVTWAGGGVESDSGLQPELLGEPSLVVCLLKGSLGVGGGDHVGPQCVGDRLMSIVDSDLPGGEGPGAAKAATV